MSTKQKATGKLSMKRTTLAELEEDIKIQDLAIECKERIADSAEKEYRKKLNLRSAHERMFAKDDLNKSKALKKAKEELYQHVQTFGFK